MQSSLRPTLDSRIRIQILEMMISRLRIANYGNLFLVFAISGFVWNLVSQKFLVIWVLVNILVTLARIQFFYKRYERSDIDDSNVNTWLTMFCVSLSATNLVWAAAFLNFMDTASPVLVVIVMFCFFTIVASGIGTLSVYMPAFFWHGIPLVSTLMAYFFFNNEPNFTAYGFAVFTFYFVAALLARSGNSDMQMLIELQIEKQEIAAELELKKEQAEQALLEKDRFLAAASHDLRQPLHSASLLLSSLARYVKEPPATEILGDTSEAVKALNHSFSSLLDVSKLDAGVIKPHLQHIHVQALLHKIAKEYSLQAQRKKIDIILGKSDLYIHSDKALTERILRNILSNAIQYTDSGSINMYAEKHSDMIRITFADTGNGIAPQEQTLIFSEYYQINNPERDRSQGFGLGLSIVKRLTSLLNGEIHLESELGVGSKFTVSFNAGEADKAVEPQTNTTNIGKFANLNVLVIDDDIGVRNAMKVTVDGWGCGILTAESANEAITLINQDDFLPGLILADYRLRDNKTGVSAIEAIRDELNIKVPAIIITGDTSPQRIKQASDSGFLLLHKPVSVSVLRAAMQQALV